MKRNTHVRHAAAGHPIGALLIAAVAFCAPLAASAATVPVLKPDASQPTLKTSDFASLLVIDTGSGKTLYHLDPDKSWTPASLTKLMNVTTFTATPTKWDSRGRILSSDEVGGGRLVVPVGSSMTLRDLVYSAIVGSANNAAEALGRIDGPGRTSFITKMNARAQQIGLTNSVFHDASGMNETNKTTAYDMANLFREASSDPEVHGAMTASSYQFTASASKPIAKNIKNTNTLITGDPSVVITGGKTGYLVESRYNFAISAKPGAGEPQNAGEVEVIVFGAPTRDISQDASAALAKWAWNAFDWQTPSSTAVRLPRNLEKGDKGADVTALQKYLNTHGAVITKTGAGSPGKETDLFGELTRLALKKYQEIHSLDILLPQGKKSGTGYLDFTTRGFINEAK